MAYEFTCQDFRPGMKATYLHLSHDDIICISDGLAHPLELGGI